MHRQIYLHWWFKFKYNLCPDRTLRMCPSSFINQQWNCLQNNKNKQRSHTGLQTFQHLLCVTWLVANVNEHQWPSVYGDSESRLPLVTMLMSCESGITPRHLLNLSLQQQSCTEERGLQSRLPQLLLLLPGLTTSRPYLYPLWKSSLSAHHLQPQPSPIKWCDPTISVKTK